MVQQAQPCPHLPKKRLKVFCNERLILANITIDITSAVHQSAGIGRLTRETVRALLKHQPNHHLRLFCMGQSDNLELKINENLESPNFSFSIFNSKFTDRWLHRLWFKANVPVPVELLGAKRCDLYHATDFVLPPTLPQTKTVLTVHDLTFERDPDSAVPSLLKFLRRVVPQSAKRADHIIADSFATARDLTELYAIAPEKITTIHSGVDGRFCAQDDLQMAITNAKLREKYNIGDAPFILTVGTMQRRKNHLGLVRAFAKFCAQSPIYNLQSSSLVPNLVIAGGKGWLYDEVLDEVKKLGLSERVKFIGFVDDADLPDLYSVAAVFAFPSLYEGFGLPLLEAMACGVPVVSSNASSLPEVMGDVGLQIAPTDTDGWAAALAHALYNEAWRTDSIRRGLARAQQFTWAKSAKQVLKVYEQVLG